MSPYSLGLLQVHLLQLAGFRFDNESFGLQFWFDLALLKQTILNREPAGPVL